MSRNLVADRVSVMWDKSMQSFVRYRRLLITANGENGARKYTQFETKKVGLNVCEVKPCNLVTDHGYVTEIWDTICKIF